MAVKKGGEIVSFVIRPTHFHIFSELINSTTTALIYWLNVVKDTKAHNKFHPSHTEMNI